MVVAIEDDHSRGLHVEHGGRVSDALRDERVELGMGEVASGADLV